MHQVMMMIIAMAGEEATSALRDIANTTVKAV
jgi:hypothetical protein